MASYPESERTDVDNSGAPPTTGGKGWTFLTNHAHVLVSIARDPTARLRDVAIEIGITERAAQAIVADLESAGYLRRSRVGRRNHYTVNPAGHFRHPAEADRRIGDLIALFTERPAPGNSRTG
ncbi:MarR family winged helix-turn-helix transcriptional regulator [Solwaraspora sp. WMMD1047]|uniref:helix-turn-helix transcriptional regulator n=1 Tax=Solwaraspora sp. WMMD1047 TaxID=3016102 RepID=UPI002417857D|nr:MarR family winged helix-turn-helix transcriptional regulator [Solwaraspora sp. WMMD1047]MDG4831083.1 MarR family winged helix-turn-helix transcriptional regulator [Solwaraspora sp. WMMD1047]